MASTPARFMASLFLIPFVAVLSFVACSSEDPTRPADRVLNTAVVSGVSTYPIDVGNEWDYRGLFSWQVVPDTGPGDVGTIARTEAHVIIGTEVRSDRTYQVLENTIDEEGWGITRQWERLRQTKSGLYQLDIAISEPPLNAVAMAAPERSIAGWSRLAAALPAADRAAYRRAWDAMAAKRTLLQNAVTAFAPPAGGPAGDEITRLAFPLHVGASWAVRETPFVVTSTVERRQVRDVPAGREPAWRVRIVADFLSPDDVVYFWYGRTGLVEQSFHLITTATDMNGNPIGTLIGDDAMVLTATNVRPGPAAR